MTEEIFDVVDESGRVIGEASRGQCHGDPRLLHQAVHVLVFNHRGDLFLQQRSAHKDIHPGKWDTSVGGHLRQGEQVEAGARREMMEELGKAPDALAFAYRYIWRSPTESELIHAFATIDEGPFALDSIELAAGRFWDIAEIESSLRRDIFTPQFDREFPRMRAWWKQRRVN